MKRTISRFSLTFIVLALTALAPELQAQPGPRVDKIYRFSGPIYIPNHDGSVKADATVSDIYLYLVKQPTGTHWSIDYGYYNGSTLWEWNQHLIVTFTDRRSGFTESISVRTPSENCQYADPVTKKARRFQGGGYSVYDLTQIPQRYVTITGVTDSWGDDGFDHRC